MRLHEATIRTPVKGHLNWISSNLESERASNSVLKKQLREVEEAQEAKKKVRAGVSVTNQKIHMFTTEECLKKVRDIEAEKGSKGKGND